MFFEIIYNQRDDENSKVMEAIMDKFTSKHYIFLIQATGIVSMKTYPMVFMKDGGRESWIAVIIASILVIGIYTYMIGICKKYECYNFYNIYKVALGETLGKFFIFLFIATLLMTLIESSGAEAGAMHTNMLIETPSWYFLLFFILPSIYIIRKDIVAIVTVVMIGITCIMLAGINLSILTARYKHSELLFPVFSHGVNKGFFVAIIKLLGLYGSMSITLPYLNKIKDTRKIVRDLGIAILIVIQMQIVSSMGVIMTFGINFANTMSYPKLLQTQQVSYFRFLEFGELYVMLQIVGGWILKYLVTFYGMLLLLKNFNFKRKHLIYITYSTSVLVYAGAYMTTKSSERLFAFFNMYTYISFMNFIVIPLVVFIIFAMKMKKLKLADNS